MQVGDRVRMVRSGVWDGVTGTVVAIQSPDEDAYPIAVRVDKDACYAKVCLIPGTSGSTSALVMDIHPEYCLRKCSWTEASLEVIGFDGPECPGCGIQKREHDFFDYLCFECRFGSSS